MKIFYVLLLNNFLLLWFTASAQLTNDPCSGAISYNFSGQCRNVVFDSTVTRDGPSSGGCTAGERDIWYKIDLTSTTCLNFALDRKTGSNDYKIELYTGCPATTSNYVANSRVCFDGNTSCKNKDFTRTLTAGTYYIRVSTSAGQLSNNNKLAMCITYGQQSNDDCSGATVLSNGANTVDIFAGGCGYTSSASDPTSTCQFNSSYLGSGSSAWFKFWYDGSGSLTVDLTNIICTDGTSRNGLAICLYKGSCGSLTYLNSYQSVSGTCPQNASTSTTVTVSGPATQYYAYIVGLDLSNCHLNLTLSNASPLPIELISFTGVNREDGVHLYWTTATEENNDYFTFFRSTDGEFFEPIAQIPGSGNSTTLSEYKYIDKKKSTGITYYKLRQTDFDGLFAESKVIAVDPTETELSIVYLYGVKNESQLNYLVEANNEVPLEVKLIDINGRTIFESHNVDRSGLLTLPNIPNGVYLAQFISAERSISKRFVY